MNEYKTFDQVKQETIQEERCKRYYRSFDYARACALTQLIEELSKRPDFKLVSAHPLTMYNRGIEDKEAMEATKIFSIGLWCGWLIGETHYYLQIDENPFFDALVSTGKQTAPGKAVYTYATRINEMLYDGVEWDDKPETVKLLLKNLRKCIKPENIGQQSYKKDIQAYNDPFTKQSIYTY
jgi:hypothetical protein